MALTENVGSADRLIRFIVGGLLAAWGLFGAGVSSGLGILALVVGVVLIATGVLNFCPLFKLLGINSRGSNTNG